MSRGQIPSIYRHDKQCVLVGYIVDAQGPRFPFCGQEVAARAGTGASLDAGVRIGFTVGRVGA